MKKRFDNIKVDFASSQFRLTSDDSQGACEFFQQAILSDKTTLEFLKINIKTLINYNKTTVYLDSRYADRNKWSGESKIFKVLFDKLKLADKQEGYFNPITLKSLEQSAANL